MGIRVASRICVLTAMAVLPSHADWIKLTTPHFEMYTTNARATAIEALEKLEQARAFFDDNSPSQTATDEPIRIIAFDSEKEFRPYSPNPGAIAYYHRGHGRDYIVMRDLGPGSYAVAIHEYTHLYLEHRNFHVPLWLNEGLADVYSTLQMQGTQLIIGLAPPGRLQSLRTLPVLNLQILFAVDQESPYYRDSSLMRQFYSESWALAHMLLLGKSYRDEFRLFLKAVDQGEDSEESFRAVYGKTIGDVASDLRNYLSAGEMTVSSFDAQMDPRDVPEMSDSTAEQVDVVLADLLSTHRETAEEAEARLTGLAAQSPNNPDVQTSLGYLASQQGKNAEAKAHFKAAVQQGSADPAMMVQYAALLNASGGSIAEIMRLLGRAVELKPDLYDARFALGMEAATQGECDIALSALTPIKTISSERAFPLYSALTYCNLRIGHAAEARHWAELAKQYAENSQQRTQVAYLLDQLNRAPR